MIGSMMNRALLVGALLAACGPKHDTKTPTGGGDTGGSSAGNTGGANPSGAKAIETPSLLAQPLPNDPMKVTIHRLSNGMTVYLAPDNEQPSVFAQIVVRAGSAMDPQNSTGLAHYLEHMVFKGTTKLGTLDYAKEKPHLDRIAQLYADLRKPGADRAKISKEIDTETQAGAAFEVPNELDALFQRLGFAEPNAYTGNDATVYHETVPRNRLAQWARIEAARFSDPVWRLFWPELEAVYEEKNRSIDNPLWRIQESFFRTMFPKHGYGWSSGIGEVEHIKVPAYQDMEAFFARYYTPQNMAIVLAGDVDASVLPLLEKELGGFKKPPGPAVAPGEFPELAGRTQVDVPVPSNEGVILGWKLVPATHPDRVALEVMNLLLHDGTSGIVNRDLLLSQKVATAASEVEIMHDAGVFTLSAEALDGQKHDELEKLLMGVVGKLQRGDFTETDLATAVLTEEISEQEELESNPGRGERITDAFVKGESWADVVARLDRMRKLTKADITRVANKYLGKNFLVLRQIKRDQELPKIEKPGITPVKVDPTRQSAFAKSVLDMKVEPIEPVVIAAGTDYERAKLPTGELVAVKNKRNALFAVSWEFEHGSRDDKLVCLALETLPVSGAGKKSADQISRALHELGIKVYTSCDVDSSAIALAGIDRNLEAGIALLKEWLAAPAIDKPTLEARVATTLTERANTMGDPQMLVDATRAFATRGKESEFIAVPSNKVLQAATPPQLVKALGGFLHRKHRTSYFGPRSAKEASGAIVLGDGKVAGRSKLPLRYRAANTVLLTDQAMAQATIRFYWPAGPTNDRERALGNLFNEYINPLLYTEVREARGLAYGVSGNFSAGLKKSDDSAVSGYVASQTDKAHDAIEAVLATLALPIDDQHLGVAKESLAEWYRVNRIAPRELASVVYIWDDQGVKGDPRAGRIERAIAVDKASLEAWIKSVLGRKVIVSVLGDAKKLDRAKLEKLAPMTLVPLKQLFGY